MTKRRGVRLSAGSLKGRSLTVPPGARPTEARVREALFDVLGRGVRGKSFLDLFAGSGAVGLEALSRGAESVWQVDIEQVTIRRLRATYRELALDGIECRRLDLPGQLGALAPRRFDWVFADPPYEFPQYQELVASLPVVLAPGGVAVVEHEAKLELPDLAGSIERFDSRRYGGSVLSFYAVSAAD